MVSLSLSFSLFLYLQSNHTGQQSIQLTMLFPPEREACNSNSINFTQLNSRISSYIGPITFPSLFSLSSLPSRSVAQFFPFGSSVKLLIFLFFWQAESDRQEKKKKKTERRTEREREAFLSIDLPKSRRIEQFMSHLSLSFLICYVAILSLSLSLSCG